MYCFSNLEIHSIVDILNAGSLTPTPNVKLHNHIPPMGPFSRANYNYLVYMMEHTINANTDRSIILMNTPVSLAVFKFCTRKIFRFHTCRKSVEKGKNFIHYIKFGLSTTRYCVGNVRKCHVLISRTLVWPARPSSPLPFIIATEFYCRRLGRV